MRKRYKIIFVIIYVISILAVATQYFSTKIVNKEILGGSFMGVYPPWKILEWLYLYYYKLEGVFYKTMNITGAYIAVSMVVILIFVTTKRNSPVKNIYSHGSARWGDLKDIKAASLIKNDGVYIGGYEEGRKKYYLKHDGPEHVFLFAPTRSGKGVSLIVPTLLSWKESAVILDLKGELWEMTAGWRKEGAENTVIRFDPTDRDSARWNPLDEIRLGTEHEVPDCQNLAQMLVDPQGRGLQSHWDKTANTLLASCLLHLLYKGLYEGGDISLSGLGNMLSDPTRDIKDLWEEMITYPHVDGKPHTMIAAGGRDMIDRPPEEAGSVLSTAKSYLDVYRDPLLANILGSSSFRIKDLMHNNKPVSLYIVQKPSDKSRLRPVFRILVNSILRILASDIQFENGLPRVNYKHKLLLMLDEFPTLGKLQIIQDSLSYLAGYGIKAYVVAQDINQVRQKESGYGHDETLTSNFHVQIAFPPNRVETAEYISKLTGVTTIHKKNVSVSGKRTSFAMMGRVTHSYNDTQRPLLTADEAMRLPIAKKDKNGLITDGGTVLVSVAGYPVIKGKQFFFFQDKVFQERASIRPPEYTENLKSFKQKIIEKEIENEIENEKEI